MSFLASLALPVIGQGISSLLGGLFSSGASNQAQSGINQGSQIIGASGQQARQDIMSQLGPSLADITQGITTLRTQGPAQQAQAAMSGALGQEAEQAAIDSFIESPGQQFLREEQEQALLRNQGAIGGLGGGRVRSALQEQAFGIAATNQQQRFNNLGQVASGEMQTSSNIANLLNNRANLQAGAGNSLANIALNQGLQQSGLAQQLGQTQAAGTLGIGNAVQQGIGGITNLLSSGNFGNLFSSGGGQTLGQNFERTSVAGGMGGF